MRITLRTQITTALVLFGLVPASIVAWFAYQSNDDFKEKQRLIVRQAADVIGDKIATADRQSPRARPTNAVTDLEPNGRAENRRPARRSALSQSISSSLDAQVIIVNPSDKILLKRGENGMSEPNLGQSGVSDALEQRYKEQIAKTCRRIGTKRDRSSCDGITSPEMVFRCGRGRRLRAHRNSGT